MKKIRVGLYGRNGHQIHGHMVQHPAAELVAVAGFEDVALPEGIGTVRRYSDLPALLADREVDLVSLCSPLRSEQAGHAVACLKAGKHVYAEKPCAMTESDLDLIIATARETGLQFHEMAGTVVDQPYMAMRAAVKAGTIGEVVQVLAQKCYPWRETRPADERIDGGLALQAGVYVARFVEHIACQRIASIAVKETRLGNTVSGSECRRAASFLMTLENGGVASGVSNYLNPMPQRLWGYEILRIFGTAGVVESNADGRQARLIPIGKDPQALDVSQPTIQYIDLFVKALLEGTPMPLTLEEELSPTRWVIRGKATIR